MVQEAEAHADEDKTRREAIELQNNAESMDFQAEQTLTDHGDQIPAEQKADLDQKVQAVKEILEKDRDNLDRLRPAHEEMVQALTAVGTAMYEAAAAAGPNGEGGDPFEGAAPEDSTTSDDEATVEGEFREVGAER
jgi:molecular chaperone DnaK